MFVLGGPGAGKGTQCELLSKEFNIDHLSAGELLRKEQAKGSVDGQIIDRNIREGTIVPASITVSLLKKEIQARGPGRYLIDGFPRNFDNVQEWERIIDDEIIAEKVLCIEDPAADVKTRVNRIRNDFTISEVTSVKPSLSSWRCSLIRAVLEAL